MKALPIPFSPILSAPIKSRPSSNALSPPLSLRNTTNMGPVISQLQSSQGSHNTSTNNMKSSSSSSLTGGTPVKSLNTGTNTGAKTAVEAQIWKVFANKQAETWENFAGTFQTALGTDPATVAKLRFVFVGPPESDRDGMVDRVVWENFLIWFSPLDVSDIYQTSGGGSKGGYEIEHITAVCTPVWFHGFLSSADAQKALKGKSDGTFLFRFSTTNPGCYALTVAYSSTVGHWRISCEKKTI